MIAQHEEAGQGFVVLFCFVLLSFQSPGSQVTWLHYTLIPALTYLCTPRLSRELKSGLSVMCLMEKDSSREGQENTGSAHSHEYVWVHVQNSTQVYACSFQDVHRHGSCHGVLRVGISGAAGISHKTQMTVSKSLAWPQTS